MSTQMMLFGLDEPTPESCVTCGAGRPDSYTKPLWLEPVSRECGDCNLRTLREITQRSLRGLDASTAWERHVPTRTRKAKR